MRKRVVLQLLLLGFLPACMQEAEKSLKKTSITNSSNQISGSSNSSKDLDVAPSTVSTPEEKQEQQLSVNEEAKLLSNAVVSASSPNQPVNQDEIATVTQNANLSEEELSLLQTLSE